MQNNLRSTLKISPRVLALTFLAVVGLLLIAHAIVHAAYFLTLDPRLLGLVTAFSVGSDSNFPTVYSFCAIMTCVSLLITIGIREKRNPKPRYSYRFWFVLAALFVFIGVDEMLMLHERLIEPGRETFQLSGAFYYAWVIPYGILTIIVALFFSRFLLRLPRDTAELFVIAGAMFVAGAIGMEMIGGWYWERHLADTRDVPMVLMQTVEETLEMMGIIVFMYALARHAARHGDGLQLEFVDDSSH